jgi:hypothetical protein
MARILLPKGMAELPLRYWSAAFQAAEAAQALRPGEFCSGRRVRDCCGLEGRAPIKSGRMALHF